MSPHPPPGGVLAFDLSSTVGWAYGPIEWRKPLFGRFRLKIVGELEAARYRRASNMAWELIEQYRPGKVIIESPMTVFAMNNDTAARQQLGLRGIVMAEISRHGLNPEEYSPDLVRGALLGRTRFPKGTVKDFVMAWARKEGYRVQDDNEADAIALWSWYAGQIRRGLQISPGMLIDGEATDVE